MSQEPLRKVTIYTDGACKGNPGPGGWGARLMDPVTGKTKDIAGGEKHTTNNRMELTGVIRALQSLKYPVEADIWSDSSYVINAFKQNWIGNWQANGWRNSQRKPVENQDLWQELLVAMKAHKVNWNHVKGHAGHEHNEACDRLAVAAAERIIAGE
jgi:ribonuclease HI